MTKKRIITPHIPAAATAEVPNVVRWEANIRQAMLEDPEVLAYWNGVAPQIMEIPKTEVEAARKAGFNCCKITVSNITDPGAVTFERSFVKKRIILTKSPLPSSGNLEVTDVRAVAITDSFAANYDSITFVFRLSALKDLPIATVYFYTLCKVGGNIVLYLDFIRGIIQNGSATKGVKIPSK